MPNIFNKAQFITMLIITSVLLTGCTQIKKVRNDKVRYDKLCSERINSLPPNNVNKAVLLSDFDTKELTTTEHFDCGMDITFTATLHSEYIRINPFSLESIEGIEDFCIFNIPPTFTVNPENIDGMIGEGMAIITPQQQPITAKLEIELNDDIYKDGEKYFICYINEDTLECEYLPEMSQVNNVLSAELNPKYFRSIKYEKYPHPYWGEKYGLKPHEFHGNAKFIVTTREPGHYTILPD